MKKRLWPILIALAMLFSLTLIGCGNKDASGGNEATSSDEKPYTLICSHLTVEADSMHIGALKFKEIIEEKSQGRIVVDIFPNKQLASSDNELLEQCRNGSVQMAITTNFIVASLSDDLSTPNIFDFPYMFESSEELYAFANSDLGKAMNDEILEKTNGIMTYGCYSPSWYKIGTTKKPVNKMADLKGVKIRSSTSKMAMAAMNAFGANPTPINYGEVYTALQQGTVFGNATATNLILTEKYYEVMPYICATNHVPHILYPFYNAAWVEALPPDLKTAFEESALEYLDWIREYGMQVEADSLKGLEEVATVTYLDDAALKEFQEAGRSTWADNAEVAGGQEYIDKVSKWLQDYRKNKQ
jgi:tripartite ATP-independent transporter DctP family solute receptor